MIVAGGRDPSLGARDSEGPPAFEDLVPTPIFSGQVQFNTPNPISFAPATTELATPMTHGTLMADFTAEPRVLRSGDDTFLTGNFTELVITVRADDPRSVFYPPLTHTQWPGLEDEQRTPMANIIGGRDHISRAELARFVVDQFSLITSVRIAPLWRPAT